MSKFSRNFRRLSRQLSNIPQIIFTVATSQPSTTGSNNMHNDLYSNNNQQQEQQQSNQTNYSNILLNPSNLLDRLASASSQPRQFSIASKSIFTEGFSTDDDEPEASFYVDPIIQMKNANEEVNERTVQFLSITYAILLVISGAMCTFFNVSHPKNSPRDIFVIIISIIGFLWVAFFHYDITKYRKWALNKVKQQQKDFYRRSRTTIDDSNNDNHDNNNNEISSVHNNDQNEDEDLDLQSLPAYDSVSMNTAAIFDCLDQNNDQPEQELSQTSSSPSLVVTIDQNHNEEHDQESFVRFRTKPIRPKKAALKNKWKKTKKTEKSNVVAYRYFRGKHANDFYLKTGMIVFCFGSILHIGIDIVKQLYFYLHEDHHCQNPSLICMEIIRFIFSFYQLYVIFKYSNIIINRYKNLARFALMHLVGTAISCWLDTIVDEAINDYIEQKLCFNINDNNNTNYSICKNNSIPSTEDYHGLNDHIKFAENCSKSAIINSSSLNALPYLYPFTIEFNIILASIWYMFWSNIGKIKDKSLFTESYENRMWHKYRLVNLSSNNTVGNDGNSSIGGGDNRSYLSRRSSLLLKVDCHASNKGLFLGLAILLIILITIIIFFSTIHKHVSNQFGVVIYTLQILLLTFSCFFFIPIAHKRMRKLDVVKMEHRNNAFMMMEDILILIPIPFYFIHYMLSAVASILICDPSDGNNLTLIGIDILTIVQVLIQSPFIVDNLRRCSNRPEQRQKKPGRELVTLILILNVTLWILNTLELKSVEVYHASHKYFGEFFSMILSHTTLPMMLFYRFHSSVCLSHIWKYAYEQDE